MGFLSREEVLSFEKEDEKKQMQRWAEAHPFCAVMMSNIPFEEKLRYAEERFYK